MHHAQGPVMSISIENYMATELLCLAPDDDIIHAMRLLQEKHFSGAPVLDQAGQLVGMLSQKDCMAIAYNTAYHQDWGGQVEQYMACVVEHIEAGSSVLDAADKFLHSSFRRFPVLRDGQLVGQISRHDIMRALDENYLRDQT
jgi:CBS domain-containing protein